MTKIEGCDVCSGYGARLENVEKDTSDQWTAINQGRQRYEDALREIGNRLPNWAVILFSAAGTVGGAIIGVLATLVAVS